MMDWAGGSWGWGQWLAMTLSMLAVWGVLLAAIVVALRGWRPGGHSTAASPRRLLDKRFARGEMNEDAYRRARDLLDDHEVHSDPAHHPS